MLTAVGALLNDTSALGNVGTLSTFSFNLILEVCQELGCELQKCEEMLFQQEQK